MFRLRDRCHLILQQVYNLEEECDDYWQTFERAPPRPKNTTEKVQGLLPLLTPLIPSGLHVAGATSSHLVDQTLGKALLEELCLHLSSQHANSFMV